jgi:hypothetical protein
LLSRRNGSGDVQDRVDVAAQRGCIIGTKGTPGAAVRTARGAGPDVLPSKMKLKSISEFCAAVLVLFVLGVECRGADLVRITTWNLEWFPNGSAKDASPEEQDRRINASADVLRKLISAASNRGNEWLSDQDANLS